MQFSFAKYRFINIDKFTYPHPVTHVVQDQVSHIDAVVAVDFPTEVKHAAPAYLLFGIYAFKELRETFAVFRIAVRQVRTPHGAQVITLATLIDVPFIFVRHCRQETEYAVIGIVVIP